MRSFNEDFLHEEMATTMTNRFNDFNLNNPILDQF